MLPKCGIPPNVTHHHLRMRINTVLLAVFSSTSDSYSLYILLTDCSEIQPENTLAPDTMRFFHFNRERLHAQLLHWESWVICYVVWAEFFLVFCLFVRVGVGFLYYLLAQSVWNCVTTILCFSLGELNIFVVFCLFVRANVGSTYYLLAQSVWNCFYLAGTTLLYFGLGQLGVFVVFLVISGCIWLIRKGLGLEDGYLVPVARWFIEYLSILWLLYRRYDSSSPSNVAS